MTLVLRVPAACIARRAGCAVLCAVACLLALPSLAAAGTSRPARVPQGFLGAVLGAPVFPDTTGTQALPGQLDLMVSSGVESVRAVFDWSTAQPYASWSQLRSQAPADEQQFGSDGVDQVPTNWADLDTLVGQAARRHLPVLPVIIYAPAWDGEYDKGSLLAIPRTPGPYAAFCKALVLRYGPHGSFWKGFAGRAEPITAWQIWNEPNVPAFWAAQPFAARYVSLLRAAHTAIRGGDPHAKVVLAGLANYSWTALRSIYRIHGSRSLFDVVGLHPYTRTPQGVLTILRLGRRVMRAHGDAAKPMLADEISWPSAQGKTTHNVGYPFDTTEAGQAKNVSQVLPLLAANRTRLNLIGVYYYTWAGIETPNGLAFNYSGLLKYVHKSFVRKPVFYAFRHYALGLERCRQKGTSATQCLKPF
jgi:hypothetical protein